MGCPVVDYGVPSGGAPEYNVNSGRELFKCGDCVKLFITNVSVEKSTVTFSCSDVSGANYGEFCLQSASGSVRDRSYVNWIAKDGVNTTLPNGYVITRVGTCGGGAGIVYTHTEGSISVRAYANVTSVNATDLLEPAKYKLAGFLSQLGDLDFFLSNLNANVSPTDWQSMSATFSGVSTGGGSGTFIGRASFNWSNGKAEVSTGTIVYDETSSPESLTSIVQGLIG